MWSKLAMSAVLAACVCIGCSGDDNNGESQPDATNQVDVGEDSVRPDTAKADSGKDLGTDTSTPADSAIDSTLDSAVDSSIDTPPDVADATDASDAADSFDAFDAACPSGTWRDFAKGTCETCPETPVTLSCGSFDFTASHFDSATSTAHLVLNDSLAQVTSATVTYYVYGTASGTLMKTADAVIVGNDLQTTLVIDADANAFEVTQVDYTEACGGSGTAMVDGYFTASDGGGWSGSGFGCPL